MSRLSLCFVAYFIAVASANGAPNGHSGFNPECSVYTLVSNSLKCDATNYLTRFGKKYCELYLDKSSDGYFSNAALTVLPHIRSCLQKKLINDLQVGGENLKCENIDQIAAGHHVDCYSNPEFCNLEVEDKVKILYLAHNELKNPVFLNAMKKIEDYCISLPLNSDQ